MSPLPAPQVQLLRGERYTLMDNTNPHTWVVQGLGGETKRAPAACFCIPAPDPEAVARASKWVSLGIHRGRRRAGDLARPRGVRGRCLAFAWTGGEGGGSPSLLSSLQAGFGDAGSEAETGHSPEPPEDQRCGALTAGPAGYHGLAREWGGGLLE